MVIAIGSIVVPFWDYLIKDPKYTPQTGTVELMGIEENSLGHLSYSIGCTPPPPILFKFLRPLC